MKYLIARAESHAESEEIWGLLRERLLDIGLPTTRRRIQALALGRSGDWTFLEVDKETPDGDPVLAIFEASNAGLFYMCAPRQVVEGGPPHALGHAEGAPVVDFDARAVGQG
ncbi:MAG: hypothetical protein QOD42_3395 [Sphingomonadales bacterium]|jgi:hypothetical protein|nr:hypothetical protein [Sphingomonadales bacterium]